VSEDAQRMVDDIMAESVPLSDEQRERIRQFREAYQRVRAERERWAAVWAEPEAGGEG